MLKELLVSSIGKKSIMAVTGLVLIGFVIGHLLGNLKIFEGIDPVSGRYKLDVYGEFLRTMGYPLFGHGQLLWSARLVLLFCVVGHIGSAICLTLQSQKARPIPYAKFTPVTASYAARTMRVGGVVILLYIVFHLLHLTTGDVNPRFIDGHVYGNLYYGLKVPLVNAFYSVSIVILGFHLYHGIWSMFQTLGLSHQGWSAKLRVGAKVIAILVVVGYISIPMAVMFNLVSAPAYS